MRIRVSADGTRISVPLYVLVLTAVMVFLSLSGSLGFKLVFELMIEHNIGVSLYRSLTLKRIDSDYFDP